MRRVPALLALVAVPALAGDDGSGGSAGPPAAGGEALESADRPTNRLAEESSPYLRQHAHNPVDWQPWGDEAFEKARREDRPVFLSIGYSTCHWCHVMERESFEDEEIARFLNEHFVSVKVDREERPDVDAVYMAAVQAMTGQGGWPLSVFLTPDRKPFFGGTYFPPADRYGRPGFPTVLRRIEEVWRTRRDEVLEGAAGLTASIGRAEVPAADDGAAALAAEPLADAVGQFRAAFDRRHGGFGPAPKFPRAFSLSFLLGRARAAPAGDERDRIVEEVAATLEAMRRGGLHDHVGGGFHRYSTDPQWLVPHFEKMLYDQALLVRAYTDAWLVTRDPRWEATARGAAEYVLRDLRDPAGGFRTAEDADSEGEEGKFYVWTEAELTETLGAEDAAVARALWRTDSDGNFRDEATGRVSGANILHMEWIRDGGSAQDGAGAEPAETKLAELRARLLAARSRRVRPHLDDKVLADWNGLMIGALARAGAAFGEPRYVAEARRAADFVLANLRTADGALLHRWRAGEAGIPAFLDDHAFLALGLADLYEASLDARLLRESRDLLRAMLRDFRDEGGTFTLASRRGEALVARTRELYDGAIPSGNSAAALALLRVGSMTGDAELTSAGETCLRAWMPTLSRYPMGYPYALTALAFAVGPTREVVVAGDPADPATQALVAEVRRRFLPDTVLLLHAPGEAGRALEETAPFVAPLVPARGADGRPVPAAYVCRDRTCSAPVTSPADLAKLLDGE